MKETSKLVIRLLLITAVAGLVLAFANNMTAPIIAEKNAKKLAESLVDAYPDSKDFKSMDAEKMKAAIGDNEAIQEIFEVGNGEGFVFRSLGQGGFGGAIEFIVGVSKDGEIKGFKVLNHSETPGFGDASTKPEFVQGVTGNKIAEDLVAAESPSTDNDIQGISGATITTNAILGGLNKTLKVARELVK